MKPKHSNYTAIVAYDQNRGIGKYGSIPWDLPLDKALFRFLTDGLEVIVGPKTASELPSLLRRKIMVIGNQQESNSVSQFLDRTQDHTDVIIAGGAETYRLLLPYTNTIIATEIEGSFECDRFFPVVDPGDWSATLILTWEKDEQHQKSFRVVRYERKRTNI